MPNPCAYENQDDWLAACIPARQDENPDESREQAVAICYSMWRERECDKSASKGLVFKAGMQSADDPLEFILSTASKDRHGDIVVQDWDLREFQQNPIALYQHDHDMPIGIWERLRVAGGQLRGFLRLAAAGTSEEIDTIRALVEQRILRAVSVGFRATRYEPIKSDGGEYELEGGVRLMGNVLFEASLVSVPANAEALAVAKRMLGSPRARELFACPESGAELCNKGALEQLGLRSRVFANAKHQPKPKRKNSMAISDLIAKREDALNAMRAELTSLTEQINEDGSFEKTVDTQMDALNQSIAEAEAQLAALKATEKSLMLASKPAQDHRKSDLTSVSYGDGGREIDPFTKKKGDRFGIALATCFKAHAIGANRFDVIRNELGGNKPIEMIVRAATDAANTTDAAWASALVRESWSEWLDLIRDISVYPRVPGMRVMFDRSGLLTFPRNAGRGMLAGGFVAQGAPIPVKEGSVNDVSVQHMSMAVISTFTKQLASQSIPSIQSVIQGQMLGDTAETMDTLFLDAVARSTTRPAGLRDPTETGAANIVAASGTGTVADIIVDVNALLGRVYVARTGTSGAWLMNPLTVLGLINKQDAASGFFPFRDEVLRGTFQGYPIIKSQNVTSGIVAFVSDQAMVHAAKSGPTLEVSDQATLHFEDTTPLAIGTVGIPNTVAAPVRSLWQHHMVGVKLFMELDWRIVRIGGVQVLTAVAW